jgi:2-methylisocitrate lyase-like PEP mutase family enzyme
MAGRFATLGGRRVSVPRMLPAAATRAMQQALALFRQSVETSEVVDRPDRLALMEDIKALMGHEELERLEERFPLPERLLQKYGTDRVNI